MKKLRPVIRKGDRLFVGQVGEHHDDVQAKYRLASGPDKERGFSADGKTFLSRLAALGWLKYHAPEIHKKVMQAAWHVEGLHSQELNDAMGVLKPEESIHSTDLSKKNVLVFDLGLFVYPSRKLGEQFGKVWYYLDEKDPFPSGPLSEIGKGYQEIERVQDPWEHIDKADLVYFPDCYNGPLQEWLRSRGFTVFGSGNAESIELSRPLFFDTLEKVGLEVPETDIVAGEEELKKYLRGAKDKWIKTSYYRGDFETYHFINERRLESWLDDLKNRIGRRIDRTEFVIQESIPSKVEIGYDGFLVDGSAVPSAICGYEIKASAYCGKFFEKIPGILSAINDALTNEVKKLGQYRGHWSTEVRVTEGGVPYFIDPCCRAPSPPVELMTEMLEDYPLYVWQIANGIMPKVDCNAKFGAQIVLDSSWLDKHELLMEYPKELEQWVKLRNSTRRKDRDYSIPNGGGAPGSVIALGSSSEEAQKKCLEYIKEVDAECLEWEEHVFDKMAEIIEAGRKFAGMDF